MRTNAQENVILKKFQPAPFDGVLTTEKQWRFYVDSFDACEIVEGALSECQNEIASQDTEIISVKNMIMFGVGLFLGAKLSKL